MIPRALCLILGACVLVVSVAPSFGAPPAQKFSRGLLWRVSQPGVAPSYVFGTIHLADPRVLELPEPVTRALARSKHYYMESYLGPRERI